MKVTGSFPLRADSSHGILATIQCRIFCLPLCYPKI